MPRYKIGDETFRRKNLYLPCAIAAKVDDLTDAEHAAALRAAYWADNITNAEWPVILGTGGTRSTRSKLKRKAAGWLMAFSRIAYLDPALAVEIMERAAEMYEEQITAHGGGNSPVIWDEMARRARQRWLPTVGNDEAEGGDERKGAV